ncbi:ankyrin repeat-containing domain protein [Apiospora arundinis]
MAPNAPTEDRHIGSLAARDATEITDPDNGPREEHGEVPGLGSIYPFHHFNLRGAESDHEEDEIEGYMQYVSGVNFRHRSIYRSPDRRGPRAPEPARPDSNRYAIRRPPELLGTINGADAIRRNGPQPILAGTGEGVAGSQVPVARFQSGSYSGVSSVTITSGSRRTFRPGTNAGPPNEPFQSAFRDIFSHGPSVPPFPNLSNPRFDDQEGLGGPRFLGGISGPGNVGMDLPAILHHLLLTVHNPNAVHGDVVHSLEALDRIITSLMEAYPQSNAAPPASNETISKLPRKKLDEEMLGREIKGKCTVCIDDVGLGDEVVVLPCKHWFHDGCVGLWLKEHNTCPICRASLDLSVYGSAFATALKSQRPIASKSPFDLRTSQGSIR